MTLIANPSLNGYVQEVCCKLALTNLSNPTAAEKEYWDRLCREIGCIACRHDGYFNPVVSIHHCGGRTKPDCHKKVLPLCAGHHQDGTQPDSGKIAIHPWKKRFESMYGTQAELMDECKLALTNLQ